MRLPYKLYLVAERLMIEHDELPSTTEEELDLIHETCLASWSQFTRDERVQLRARRGDTREVLNPTKIEYESDFGCYKRCSKSLPVDKYGEQFTVCAPIERKDENGNRVLPTVCGICRQT